MAQQRFRLSAARQLLHAGSRAPIRRSACAPSLVDQRRLGLTFPRPGLNLPPVPPGAAQHNAGRPWLARVPRRPPPLLTTSNPSRVHTYLAGGGDERDTYMHRDTKEPTMAPRATRHAATSASCDKVCSASFWLVQMRSHRVLQPGLACLPSEMPSAWASAGLLRCFAAASLALAAAVGE
ncbi:hypothetical protein GQ53DRAFT_753650 [Thozetella sp. PMI_491]|nr:hypothetical protein GQ53DRAFT_753650 [Thozetella sp. PMI_491]